MYALITGASSGIGKAFATALARDYKCNIVAVSNQEKELKQVAEELSESYGVTVYDIFIDLAQPDAADTLYRKCKDIEVDILINNAGMFFWTLTNELDPKRLEIMINLHVLTLTKLCRLFGKDMCERASQEQKHKKRYIINMSSMTTWMAIPGIQCYNATKAYVLNFSKSLWYEYKPYGVTVTAMTPGAIDTPLYGLDSATRRKLVKTGISLTPDKLVKKAIKAAMKGKKQAMPGWINHLAVPLIKHLPDWAIFFAMKRFPQYKNLPL